VEARLNRLSAFRLMLKHQEWEAANPQPPLEDDPHWLSGEAAVPKANFEG